MNRRNFTKNIGIGGMAVFTLPVLGNNVFSENMSLAGAKNISRQLADNKQALVNPHMGWTMHYYSNKLSNYGSRLAPSDTLDDFPGLSVVYLRVPWSTIQPEEGKFHWEVLDTPAQRWIEKGKRVAFRISAEESWLEYATPKWVRENGAKGYDVKLGAQKIWEPRFDDPVFLEKVENFVSEMAKRYDGKPYVDFVDVGHFGMWGEGHTVFTEAITKAKYTLEVKKKHIDIYLQYFKNTLLCISDDFAGHDKPGRNFPITDYALSKGVTLRDDSIMVQKYPRNWYHSEMAQEFWPKLPVILEHEHYGASLDRGAWDKALFLKSIEDYHASYMSIHWWPRVLLKENRDVIDKINLRMGYRLNVDEVSWPQSVTIGEPFIISSTWKNVGVAPCYGGGFLCYTLKDEKGGIAAVLVDDQFDFRQLQVAQPGKSVTKELNSIVEIGAEIVLIENKDARNIPVGSFDIYFSVGNRDGTPVYELPYNECDGHKRYKLGTIKVAAENK